MNERDATIYPSGEAFDAQARQARNDWLDYLDRRPYQDERGNAHAPLNHELDGAGANLSYENMSMSELARRLGQAEFNQDRTSSGNISDALIEKLAAVEAGGSSRALVDNLLAGLLRVKDGELAKLRAEDSDGRRPLGPKPELQEKPAPGSHFAAGTEPEQPEAGAETRPKPQPAPRPKPRPAPSPRADRRGINAYRGEGLSDEEAERLKEIVTELAWAEKDYIDLAARRERTTVGGYRGKSHGPRYLTERYYTDFSGATKTRLMRDANGDKVRAHVTDGRASARKTEAARQRYEQLRKEYKRLSMKSFRQAGLSPSLYMLHSRIDDDTEANYIGSMIEATRHDYAAPKGEGRRAELTQKFYDWWVRQGGGGKFFSRERKAAGGKFVSRQRLAGALKKGTVIAIPSFVFGGALAVVLPLGAVAGLGGLAGLGVAKGYTRGLASGRIERNARDSVTLASEQGRIRRGAAHAVIAQAYAGENAAVPGEITGTYAQGTKQEVNRNRARLAVATAIGGFSAYLGGLASHAVENAIFGGGHQPASPGNQPTTPHHEPTAPPQHPTTPPSKPTVPPSQVPPQQPTQPPVHGVTGQEFYVEHGSGIIREMQEYASAHNYKVSDEQVYEIYQHLQEQYGRNIVDLEGKGPDTYVMNSGGIGLRHPGEANWYPGVENSLRELLAKAAKK